MSGFTKLFSCITSSSIWNEDDKTRIVWVTMLALCDPDGVVRASVGGLAHTARVCREDCEKAIHVLESPDPDSRSPEFEGRRIERVNGGFRLLNYGKYREARSDDERREYMREYMQNYRKRGVNNRKQSKPNVSRSKPPLAQAEAEEKAEGEAKKAASDDFISPLKGLPEWAHINFQAEEAKARAWIADHPGRKFTRSFFVNWITKVPVPEKPPEPQWYVSPFPHESLEEKLNKLVDRNQQ